MRKRQTSNQFYVPSKTIKIQKMTKITIQQIKNKGVSQQQLAIYKQAFDLIDFERIGFIQPTQLQSFFEIYQIKENYALSYNYFKLLQNKYQVLEIDFQRFADIMSKRFKSLQSNDDFSSLFKLFLNQSDQIMIKPIHLRQVKNLIKQQINKTMIYKMILKFGDSQQDEIYESDFIKIFKQQKQKNKSKEQQAN